MTRPTYNYIAPEQEASITLSDADLITAYNNILTFTSDNAFITSAKQDMREQLISRDIITEEHEGDVVS